MSGLLSHEMCISLLLSKHPAAGALPLVKENLCLNGKHDSFLWCTLLESPSGMSKVGYYVREQTIASGHLDSTFVFQTAGSCLVSAIVKYKLHILFFLTV